MRISLFRRDSPPSHIKWKWSTTVDGRQSEAEPDETKPPHDQCKKESQDVRDLTGDWIERVSFG